MNRTLPLLAAMASMSSAASAAITIPTVQIGHAGNSADPTTGYGSVAYAYNIGTTEVTNAHYVAFLNAVAVADTHDLFSTGMASDLGGISRSGSPGSYHYATSEGRANNPVNFVTFWDAARFCNWLHNGQPPGAQDTDTTEDGAYALTAEGIASNTITRSPEAEWAIPSQNEWYKAAYYQPQSLGGDADDYWLYPLSSNSVSTLAANYDNVIGNTTPVGSYGANFYGTFDMGGNVWEWNDDFIDGVFRGLRGGAFITPGANLQTDAINVNDPWNGSAFHGFRVSQVPGSSSVALLGLGGLVTLRRRR